MKKVGIGIGAKAATLPTRLLRGLLVGLAVMLLGALVITLLIDLEKVEVDSAGYGTVAVLLLMSFISSAVALGKQDEAVLLTAGLNAGCLAAVQLLINAIAFDAAYEGVAVTLLVIFAGSGAAVLLKLRPGKRKNYPVTKKWNR